jgi:arylsulfatase A-like enzyme
LRLSDVRPQPLLLPDRALSSVARLPRLRRQARPPKPQRVDQLARRRLQARDLRQDHVFKENPVGPVYHEGDQFCVGNLDKHPLSKRAWSSGVYEKGSEWDTTGRILSGSLAFLERTARAPETPFFLTLNFQDPHPFFACPEPYASLFKPEQFELPPNYRAKAEEGELRRLSLWREHSRGGEAGELELKKAMATYCGQIRYVDDAISSVLDKLDELGMADDTIVLFWSDHGDYLGEFGVTHKQAAYYDSLVHVPAILKDPTGRIAKGRRSSLTECMDLMASVLDLCGIPRPEGSLARSLVRDPSPRRDVFAAGGLRFKTPERPLPDILLRAPFQPSQYGPGAMLRTDEWKLCLYADGDAELFDMKNDTCEMRNLYSDQEALRRP